MKFDRGRFLHMAAGAAALPAVSRFAWAQAYPSRPVRLVVGFPAGGANDLHARLIAEWLSKDLNGSFIVENRPGAAGNLGTEAVVRAAQDGYTLYAAGSTEMRNEILYSNLKFSFMRDLAPVAGLMHSPNVLIVHPSFPARTIPELIAVAKANPDRFAVASPGVGSSAHVAWELFRSMTGTRMLHVPYRGSSQALTDLLGQRVQVYFSTIADALEHIKSGNLRAIAVAGPTRTSALPGIPTISESVPGYEAVGWLGIVAPKNTPASVVDTLNKAINAGLADPKVKQTIADWGEDAFIVSPAAFGKFIANEKSKWGKLILEVGIKLE
jgi:tripartite-type tricarboxylate transporter receptor subunit TctC